MSAIVVKSHSTDTSDRAEQARIITGFPIFGGVALNYSVGGLNPYAVLECARQGGRIVWLPTLSARHFLQHATNVPILAEKSPLDAPGLVVLDESGALLPQMDEILALIKEHDMVLCSGHINPAETKAVFQRAADLGISRLVITHPHADFDGADSTDVRALADLGVLNDIH